MRFPDGNGKSCFSGVERTFIVGQYPEEKPPEAPGQEQVEEPVEEPGHDNVAVEEDPDLFVEPENNDNDFEFYIPRADLKLVSALKEAVLTEDLKKLDGQFQAAARWILGLY